MLRGGMPLYRSVISYYRHEQDLCRIREHWVEFQQLGTVDSVTW